MPTDISEGQVVLKPGQIYLWTLSTEGTPSPATAHCLHGILSDSERDEARRFQRLADWQQFVVARALLRTALSRHFLVPAGDWRFDRDENGKPFIVAPALYSPARFSVSHTQGLVACLITLSAEAAGVDVEKIEHKPDLPLVAEQVLSNAERAALSTLSGKEWTTRFFEHWTLKEAYAKARGLGLGLAFRDISFETTQRNTELAQFAFRAHDNSSAWVFWHRHLPSRHIISVAVKKHCSREPEIVLRQVMFQGKRIALAA